MSTIFFEAEKLGITHARLEIEAGALAPITTTLDPAELLAELQGEPGGNDSTSAGLGRQLADYWERGYFGTWQDHLDGSAS